MDINEGVQMQDSSLTRRRFLTAAGLASAGLIVAEVSSPFKALASISSPQFNKLATQTRVLMGTFVTISLNTQTTMQADIAFEKAFLKIEELQAIFSRYDSNSPLYELNAAGSLRQCPNELSALLSKSLRFASLSNGSFDPTVKPMLDLFKSEKNFDGQIKIDRDKFLETRQLVGYKKIKVEGKNVIFAQKNMGITLDGIAKGHIADCVATLLISMGIDNYLINAGGDIVTSGLKSSNEPWTIAIENPLHTSHRGTNYPAIVQLRQKMALATSGSYEIYFDADRTLHHLINPKTGISSNAIRSATVLSATAMEADALATTISVMPPHDAINFINSLPQRECYIILNDGNTLSSRSWAKVAASS